MLTKNSFKGQVTKNFIGIMVVIIIGVAVVIPVVDSVIKSANLTGTTATLVNLLPLFIAIALNGLTVHKMYGSQETLSSGWSLLKSNLYERWAIAMP